MAAETVALPEMAAKDATVKVVEIENPKDDVVPGLTVNEEFIRAAIEQTDINSLRIALYQSTKDKELEAMHVTHVSFRGGAGIDYIVSEEDKKIVKAKALEYLLQGPHKVPGPVPSKEESARLMDLFADIPMKDNPNISFAYEEGHEELGFEEFPREVNWTKDAPPAEVLANWKVIIIGAGISGIAAAIPLKRLGIPFEIIERQGDTGGTWLLNNYPNVRVDSPSCLFQYRFTKNYKWKEYFPAGGRIKEYLQWVANEYGITEHIKYNREVVGSKWNEKTSKWEMKLKHKNGDQVIEESIETNIIISSVGLFNTPNLPDIKGIETYKGPIFHTSKWDHDFDYKGKRVGLIGTGSTGTQLAPAVALDAKNLTIYMRTPPWIAPFPFFNSKISDNVHWLFENMPYYWNWFCYGNFFKSLNFFTIQKFDQDWIAKGGMVSERNDNVRKALTEYVQECLADRPDLIAKMIPKYAPMVRRTVVDNGFYATVQRDNVDLVTEGIDRITEKGILTKDGIEREFDMIALGAGFKVTQYLWPVEYLGTEGMTLEKMWEKDGARSYLGLTMPHYPNLFMFYGPNHQPRAGSLHSYGETWARYAVTSIIHLIETGSKSMEVKKEVYDDYQIRLDAKNNGHIWESDGAGYFVNKHGRQAINMPWTTAEYHGMIIKPNYDDFHIK